MKLLLKAPNWIGDCVMATPAVAYLRRALPFAHLTMLTRPSTAGLWLEHPDLDRVLVADDRRIPPETMRLLKNQRYDAAVLFPNSFQSALLAWRLGIPRRFGYARSLRAWLLTDPIVFRRREWQTPTPKPLSRKSLRGQAPHRPPRHMVEYYVDLAVLAARQCGSALPAPVVDRATATPSLCLPVSESARQRIQELLASHGVHDLPLIGIHPGAAYGDAKRWPIDRLAAAADELARCTGAVVVITAGPAEQSLSRELLARLRSHTLNLGPSLDLPLLAALLEKLLVFVGNDTGVTHMAAAVGTPTVAVFGPMDWNVTCPWSVRSVVVRRSPPCAPCFLRDCPIDHRCMTAVEPDDVVEAALALLESVGRRDSADG